MVARCCWNYSSSSSSMVHQRFLGEHSVPWSNWWQNQITASLGGHVCCLCARSGDGARACVQLNSKALAVMFLMEQSSMDMISLQALERFLDNKWHLCASSQSWSDSALFNGSGLYHASIVSVDFWCLHLEPWAWKSHAWYMNGNFQAAQGNWHHQMAGSIFNSSKTMAANSMKS